MITYVGQSTCVNPLESRGNYDATPNNMKLVQWLLMGGWWHWYSEEGTGRGLNPPRPLLTIPNVTAHPSTASVPITILLCHSPLLCSFNVGIKGLSIPVNLIWQNTYKNKWITTAPHYTDSSQYCRVPLYRTFTDNLTNFQFQQVSVAFKFSYSYHTSQNVFYKFLSLTYKVLTTTQPCYRMSLSLCSVFSQQPFLIYQHLLDHQQLL